MTIFIVVSIVIFGLSWLLYDIYKTEVMTRNYRQSVIYKRKLNRRKDDEINLMRREND